MYHRVAQGGNDLPEYDADPQLWFYLYKQLKIKKQFKKCTCLFVAAVSPILKSTGVSRAIPSIRRATIIQ